MNWLQRLKSHQTPPAGATEPTEPGFVGFVAPDSGALEDSRAPLATDWPAAANAAVSVNQHAVVTRSCADCLHLSRVDTCLVPVAAGLLTEAEGYGIAWPPEGHGAGCAAFSGKAPRKAQDQPYRLTPEQSDAAHADALDDAAIARFQDRVQRLLRLGYGTDDADDLAERLHRRDVEGDDRVMCMECSHYRPGRCVNHRHAGLQAPDLSRDRAALLQRCAGSQPMEVPPQRGADI